MLRSSSNFCIYKRSTLLKFSELEILTGTTFWKETIQLNNPQETLVKFHIWTESFQELKSPLESHIWTMLTCQELQPNGSGTSKLQLLHGDLSTTSSICAIITDLTRELLWENTLSQMFISNLDCKLIIF